jgi:Matrixin
MSMGYEPFEEPEPYPDRGRSVVVRTVALIVLLAFGAAYAATNLASFLRNRDIATEQAPEDPRGFRFLSLDPETHLPVRYDPCTPLHYVINPAAAPKGGLKDVHGAVRLAAEATGIQFAFDGLVDEPLIEEREPVQEARYGHRWAPLLIGWIPFDARIFKVDDVGVAGSLIERNDAGRLVYVTGRILLNGADQLDNGFRPGKTWGKVVLHELGHVLGLGHVADPAQVMHPSLVSSPAAWGTGDLAGLTQLGKVSGCVEVPRVP